MPTTANRRAALVLAALLCAPWSLPHAHAQSALGSAAAAPPALMEQPPPPSPSQDGLPVEYPRREDLLAQTVGDAKAYFTAPLHWSARDWEFFGGALGAIAIAHHYDTQARNHFDSGYRSPLGPPNSGELTDALPGAALFLGTFGLATLIHSHAGDVESWNMLESGGLSLISAYAIKYIFRRARPDATTNPNHWFSGGTSFPSEHATAAFAVGTIFAESGNPKYRWIRRTIGYGVGIYTAYLRMKHNAHWLSDTVAGAALGMATAHFVMDRSQRRERGYSGLSIAPVPGGIMLAYSASFDD